MEKDSLHHGPLSPEFALLGFLYQQPCHGYDLHRRLLGELGHVWHVSQSQTYSILKRLETQGQIAAKTIRQEKHPPRQIYSITASGRRRFDEWLGQPTGSSVRAVRLEFVTRLYFAQRLVPQQVEAIIENQTAQVKAALTRLETGLASLPEIQVANRLSLRLRIQQLKSVLIWLSECRQEFGKS